MPAWGRVGLTDDDPEARLGAAIPKRSAASLKPARSAKMGKPCTGRPCMNSVRTGQHHARPIHIYARISLVCSSL
jgi:hypothetical protein